MAATAQARWAEVSPSSFADGFRACTPSTSSDAPPAGSRWATCSRGARASAQRSWRTNAELGAIETASRAMVHLAEQGELGRIRRIGLPRIGAGLGGQPWPDVRNTLEAVGAETRIELVVFETYTPS
jgi:hypothetical protein